MNRKITHSVASLVTLMLLVTSPWARGQENPSTPSDPSPALDDTGTAGDERDPTRPPDSLIPFIEDNRPKSADNTPQGLVRIKVDDEGGFEEIHLSEVPLARAAGEIGRAVDANIVVSRDVADQKVTLILRKLDLKGAIEALSQSQGLVVRQDENSGLYTLSSPEQLRQDLSAFRTEETEVFTLLYPNAIDVAQAIGDLFADRVVVSLSDPGEDTREDLEERFERFDLLESRSRGIVDSSFGGNVSSSRDSRDSFSDSNRSDRGRGSSSRILNQRRDDRRTPPATLTADQARALERELAGLRDPSESVVARQLAQRGAVTYVTVLRRLNRLVVRTSDERMLGAIRQLIQRLDVPIPLVLLEVKVLRVDLSDGLDSAFDFAFNAGDSSGSFSTGEIAPPPAGSVLPGGTGFNSRAGIFQVVSNNFQARLQLLQSKGKVTSLATPLILTANGEVSRIFSGEQIPLVIGFTESQIIVTDGGQTTVPPTPITELRDVGTDLLLTANINADRTVTMRLLQETSSINQDGATILVPNGTTFVSAAIDTVRTQSASGTVIASDGNLLAFGGLIEETVSDEREQWPILGDIPVLGLLFKRESTLRARSELIVLVRPYILNTPVEGDRISRDLLKELSMHPYQDDAKGDFGVFRDEKALGPDDGRHSLIRMFRFHNEPNADEPTP